MEKTMRAFGEEGASGKKLKGAGVEAVVCTILVCDEGRGVYRIRGWIKRDESTERRGSANNRVGGKIVLRGHSGYIVASK